jgi:hypothetical protein
MTEKDKKMTAENNKLRDDLSIAQQKIKTKIIFDDTKYDRLNRLNLPSFDKGVKVIAKSSLVTSSDAKRRFGRTKPYNCTKYDHCF